ncbi:MAG TPA: transporter substrate-binding domain-containing protein [Fervidobacterium nodosum]|nr:transporter substrate-binding domain-containing protein [Fervidobacterium nodosum]
MKVKMSILFLFLLIFGTYSIFGITLYTYPQNAIPKYFKSGNTLTGLCNDIIEALNMELSKENIKIEYKSKNPLTISEIFNALEKNEIDIFIGAAYSEDRKDKVQYVKTPLYGLREMFIVRKGRSAIVQFSSLARIGVIGSTVTSQSMPNIFSKSEIITFKNIDEALKALDKNKIDALFYSSIVLGYILSQNPNKYEKLNLVDEKYYHYIVLSKKVNNYVSQKIEEAIKSFHKKGTIASLINKYKLQDYVLPGNVVEILTVDWKPYEWYDEKEKIWKGFDVDTVTKVFEKLGYKVVFRTLPWERCLDAMKNSAYDGIMSLRINDERKTYLVFPDEPLSTGYDLLFKMKNKNIDISSLENIPSNVICGYSAGYAYGDWFFNAKFRKEPVVDDVMGFNLLKVGRIDLFVCNLLVGKSIIKDLGMENDVEYSKIFGEKMIYYIAFSKNFHGTYLSEIFTPELQKFKKSSDYENILKKYGLTLKDLQF